MTASCSRNVAFGGLRAPRHREGRAHDPEAKGERSDFDRGEQDASSNQNGGHARDDNESKGNDIACRCGDGGDPHDALRAERCRRHWSVCRGTPTRPHRSAVWYGPEVWLGSYNVPARPRRIAEYVDLAFARYGRQLLPSGTLHLQATRLSGSVPQKDIETVATDCDQRFLRATPAEGDHRRLAAPCDAT